MLAQTQITPKSYPPAMPLARTALRAVEPMVRKNACEYCRLNSVCVPEGLDTAERDEFTGLVFQHKRLAAGERLYHAGEAFSYLYYVKTGSLKSVMLLQDGREQVTGFHLAGDTLGLDAVGTAAHPSEAVALEDAWVCAIPYQSLMQLSRRAEPVQHYVQRLLSRELVRDQGVMLMLGRMQAAERVAAFLLGMAQRYKARGLSAQEFVLPMVREDIGNYLGLTLETVSRCLSRFKRAGLIEVDNRRMEIINFDALQSVIGSAERIDSQ
jgi:CRP/FNR family transcriptional regulator